MATVSRSNHGERLVVVNPEDTYGATGGLGFSRDWIDHGDTSPRSDTARRGISPTADAALRNAVGARVMIGGEQWPGTTTVKTSEGVDTVPTTAAVLGLTALRSE